MQHAMKKMSVDSAFHVGRPPTHPYNCFNPTPPPDVAMVVSRYGHVLNFSMFPFDLPLAINYSSLELTLFPFVPPSNSIVSALET